MMLANHFYRPSRVLAACCLLALSGCASKAALNNQLANTRDAVDQARMAGASETAPAEFNAAVDKLNQADAASKKWSKGDAMQLAQEAQVDANLARARTDATQARMAAVQLEKSNQILRDTYRARQNQ
jgi:hypothetical protein